LVDPAEFLTRFKPPVSDPGIITNSGAIKGFSIDFCDRLGLDIPVLGPATTAALKAALPPFASLDNPLDVTAQVLRDLTIWTRSATALLDDPNVGSLCVPVVPGSPKLAMDKVQALLPTILASGKPTMIAALGDEFPIPPEFIAAFRHNGIQVLRSPERALRALAHATAYGKRLAQLRGKARVIEAPSLPRPGRPPLCCFPFESRRDGSRTSSDCRPRAVAAAPLRRGSMSDHVYSITEIVGSSQSSLDDAVRNGIKTAAQTLRNLEWFEVTQIRGHIVEGDVGHFQVCMKLGLRYERK